MKLTSVFAAIACAIFFAPTFFAKAQSKQPETKVAAASDSPRKVVRVQVEFIEVSHEMLTDLLSGENKPQDDVAMRKNISELVKQGKARIFETLLCSSLSGTKSLSRSGLELIYPTTFEPAQISTNPVFPTNGTPQEPKYGKDATGPSPVEFDTRDLGNRMECEATIQPNLQQIDLIIAPEIISHVGFEAYSKWKGAYDKTDIKMPNIYAIKFHSSITVSAGKPFFISAVSPKDENGKTDTTRKLMVFVKADIVP
jgi:hypothetical protein